ncbi:MAG: ATPase domain-containing protein [Desulfurococcaceae archaeon]
MSEINRLEPRDRSRKAFELGVDGLNKLLGEIQGPYTLLISGHPGAGKTTLASMICYYNTLIGHNCLFVTVYEDKEKLFKNMEKFGIHMDQAERRGSLRFIRLPISLDIRGIIDTIGKNLGEGYDLVIVDSISALLEPLKDNAERRAYLLNYFYQIPLMNNGLLVLISELPYGAQIPEYLTTEFIADAVIVLKHRIEDGFLIRNLELRKTRGKPLYIVEVPFSISESRGVFVHAPTLLEELPHEKEELEFPCETLAHKIGHVYKDFFVNVFYPQESIYGDTVLLVLLGFLLRYNLKGLVISYISSPHTITESIVKILLDHGIDHKKAEKIIREHLIIKSLNPYAQSISELSLRELDLINKIKPDIVVFHGSHVIKTDSYRKYYIALYNQLLYMKHLGIGVLRILNCTNVHRCRDEASLSDLTFKIKRVMKGNKYDFLIVSYRRFKEPVVMTREDIQLCIGDIVDYIKKTI